MCLLAPENNKGDNILKCRHLAATALIAASTIYGVPAQAQTGTAFAVTDSGLLVTSAHVVTSCGELTVRQAQAEYRAVVTVSNPQNDLALLKLDRPTPHFARIRSSPPLRAGERALTFGFPFYGTLSAQGNLTIGNVSALHGLKDDPDTIQITTPVQPGSSGGPLLDRSGNLIGVVSAELDAVITAPILGNSPQSVNFAVALPTIRRFLQEHGVRTAEASSNEFSSSEDIGERAKLYSYLVVCAKPAPQRPVADLPTSLPRVSPPTVERGKRLTDRWCVTCHLGLVPAPLFVDIARDPTKTPEGLKAWIKSPGSHKMPAFNFSDRDLDDIVAYILSSHGPVTPTTTGQPRQ